MPAAVLVLRFHGRAVEDIDEVREVEDALSELLGDGEDVDGHEFAADAREIRIATADARATFAHIAPFLARAGLLDQTVAVVRSPPGERESVVWPPQ